MEHFESFKVFSTHVKIDLLLLFLSKNEMKLQCNFKCDEFRESFRPFFKLAKVFSANCQITRNVYSTLLHDKARL